MPNLTDIVTGNVATWVNGVVGGFIAAAAGCIGVIIADPVHFNPQSAGGLKKLGVVVLINGIVGAALYLKQHPTPWNGTTDRRAPLPPQP